MKKSIIIIGGGIAGLTAGIYGQINGYDTKIFEMHNLPGGLCTAWNRKGYTFDGCIHWLVGSSPSNSFYKIWRELGVLEGKKVINHDEFLRIKGKGDKELILYTKVDKLEKHMKELAPEDAIAIEEFTGAVRKLTKFNMPIDKAPELYGFIDGIKSMVGMVPYMGLMMKYGKITTADFAKKFKNEFLRETFGTIFSNKPLVIFMFTMSWMHIESAGYPEGGSLEFAKGFEKRYKELGGELKYTAKVEKIIVENDRAVGVELADGSKYFADYVISAADGHTTIFKMLEGKYTDDKIKNNYVELPIFEPIVQVSIGVNENLSHTPHSTSYVLDEPATLAGDLQKQITVNHYCYDKTLAPVGKSVIEVLLQSHYNYWVDLYKDKELYEKEKKVIAEYAIELLEKYTPGIKEKIEVVDVATPMTYERYTGNWQGSYQGWLPTLKSMTTKMNKTLPGLNNFYVIGQWVEPGGGLPPAAMSGRNVIQILCNKDKKDFITA